MDKIKYVAPVRDLSAFNCPICNAFSRQVWYSMQGNPTDRMHGSQPIAYFIISICEHCTSPTIWYKQQMVFPLNSAADLPNPDLPDEIKYDFEEARHIANLSPRGAAALLRLAIQKLCKSLGQPGKDINMDIKALVANGLPVKVQQALDAVRVIGNEAVHPGTIDLNDNPETVTQLFRLVNFIAHKMISEPKEIDDIYGKLPAGKLEAINKRDGK